MHSSAFTLLARAADNFGYVIVGMLELAPSEGTYPAARCVLHNPDAPADRAFAVSLGVMPTEDDRPAFFTGSTYDLSRSKGIALFASATQGEFMLALDNEAALEGVV
jgi:hypothetical protein